MREILNRCWLYFALAWTVGSFFFDAFLGVTSGQWYDWLLAALMVGCVVVQVRALHSIRGSRERTAAIYEDIRRLTTLPIPPTNVRVEQPDGTTIPVELVYNGWVDGCHEWVAVAPVTGLDTGGVLKADVLPAHTSITVQNIPGH